MQTEKQMERLVELLNEATFGVNVHTLADHLSRETIERVAEYLMANGVTAPAIKVGDWVYVPWVWEGESGIAFVRVEEIRYYCTRSSHYMFLIEMGSDDESFNQMFGCWKLEESIGKTVFLSREEAENALKERSNGT